jgi:hypothetical protein
MELGGDEKRIQALFSELSFENQSRAPQFGHLWTRAQAKETSAPSIGRPVAVLVSLLVTAAACSFAVWTWYRSLQTPNIVPPSVTFEASYTPSPVKPQPAKTEPRQKHIVRRRHVDRSLATEAALLSNWQSPTQQFMASPTELALGTLPTLNQSVKDLESFLSKNSEIMKESNQ